MKYILKKDLPFAKAGTQISEFGDSLIIWKSEGVMNIPPGLKATTYPIGKTEDLDKLISEGWIKEKTIKEISYEEVFNILDKMDEEEEKEAFAKWRSNLFSIESLKKNPVEIPILSPFCSKCGHQGGRQTFVVGIDKDKIYFKYKLTL